MRSPVSARWPWSTAPSRSPSLARMTCTASAWLQPRACRSFAIRRAQEGRSSTIGDPLLFDVAVLALSSSSVTDDHRQPAGHRRRPPPGPRTTEDLRLDARRAYAAFLQDAITRHLAELALSDGDVLCRTPKRTLLRRDYYNREIWKPALAVAGMAADTTFHDLRHTFASTALAEGVPISEVSRWLGTSRSRPPWTCMATWSARPAAVPATRSTERSLRQAYAPKVPRPLSDQSLAPVQRHMRGVSRPVGRVLCTRLRGPAVIHLGLPLPAASCGLPASIGRAALNRSRRPAPLTANTGPLDLAPGGVYRAAAVTCGAGGLLHHRFTLTVAVRKRAAAAVCFLWHCPAGHPGSVLPTTLPCGARTFLTGPRSGATARPTHPLSHRIRRRAPRPGLSTA